MELEVFGLVDVESQVDIVDHGESHPDPFRFGDVALERPGPVAERERRVGWYRQDVGSVMASIGNDERPGPLQYRADTLGA